MRNSSSYRTLGTLGVLLALSPGLAGCFAYTTRQRQIEAPGGRGEYSDIKKTRNARPSTRDLVQENLWYLDTGVSSPTFFWGRWIRRKELHFVAVGAPGAGGGMIGGSSDAGVVVENLLVGFDNDGRTLQWNVVDDDDVLKKMVPILRRSRIDDQLPPVPYPCQFQWDQLKWLKSGSSRHYRTISLRFFTASDSRKPTCEVNVPARVALGIVEHLISTGQESALK
jgi:hypothetical protein